MTRAIIVTGTDTGIGKTVFAAGLAGILGAHYWKPVQAGTDPEGDRETVARLAGLSANRLLPEAYRLKLPASPHLAAREEGVALEVERLALPKVQGPLVVEGAGGVLVPLSETLLMVDLFASWGAPAIVCTRTSLGTINHSLLTVRALQGAGVPVLGLAFIGDPHAENERIIPKLAGVPSLGRLALLDPLGPDTLRRAMQTDIDLALLEGAL
jgi:dethiobiotin synthetase